MSPYAILSDLHAHSWSAFSHVGEDGVNSRLALILTELDRACEAVIAAGGNQVFIAGDLFHVRGKIEPSVLNPVKERIRYWARERLIEFHIIPGNHDLENRESDKIGNAVRALEDKESNIHVYDEPEFVALDHGDVTVHMIPWCSSLADLKNKIDTATVPKYREKVDLIIHAPLNGVIKGIPDKGLDPEELSAMGFRNVFVGHYHNHKEAAPNVYSIGATTHQTWSDIGTKAGFLIVSDEGVKWHCTNAPMFIELTGEEDDDEVPLKVDGHYVRVKMGEAKPGEINAIKKELADMGALGVVVHAITTKTPTRTTATVKAGASIEESVTEFIDHKAFEESVKVKALCHDILSEARAA
jgi:DNA repair exonuclease SbcCD nuclease subunit